MKTHFWSLSSSFILASLLAGCGGVGEIISAVGSAIVASPSPSASPSSQPSATPTAVTQAVPVLPSALPNSGSLTSMGIEILKTLDPQPIPLDWNMARLPGVQVSVSSTNPNADKIRINDGKLETAWFPAFGDSARQGKLPYVEYTFPQPIGISGINLRGARDTREAGSILEGNLLVNGSQGLLLNEVIRLNAGSADYNLVFKAPLSGAVSVRLTVTRDESGLPALSEMEIVGRR